MDYQTASASMPTPSFRKLTASLPKNAANVYYRDQIGNISTSHFRKKTLELETRFPLFGGWKTSWYMGYDSPTSSILKYINKESKRLRLTIDYMPSLDDIVIDDYELRIILPEGYPRLLLFLSFFISIVIKGLTMLKLAAMGFLFPKMDPATRCNRCDIPTLTHL